MFVFFFFSFLPFFSYLDSCNRVFLYDTKDRENDIYQEFVTFLEREFREEIDAFRALRAHADLRSPQDWYPKTRQMRRKIIFHCGPTNRSVIAPLCSPFTSFLSLSFSLCDRVSCFDCVVGMLLENSGKSFEAVRALLSSSSGVYCAPLRLLALEVYHRVHSAGVLCSLFTGMRKREKEEGKIQRNREIGCRILKRNRTDGQKSLRLSQARCIFEFTATFSCPFLYISFFFPCIVFASIVKFSFSSIFRR